MSENKPKQKAQNTVREVINMVLYIAVLVGASYLIVTYVGQRTQVEGHSMEYTLSDKDNLIVDKLSYRFQEPKRFDIIVFPVVPGEDTFYIKRVIGLPGETVQIIDHAIYVNGEELTESYGKEVMESPGIAADPITLGKDEYFVLGDNRNASSDSRDPAVGKVHRKDILGKAFVRIWPLNKFGLLKHQ